MAKVNKKRKTDAEVKAATEKKLKKTKKYNFSGKTLMSKAVMKVKRRVLG